LITLGLNLVATAAKLAVGYWTGSLSLIADGFDSVFDAASNLVGLAGIYVAERPADEDHPYGHRKAETMAALIIASLLFLTTWELIKSAVERLRDPALLQAEVSVWSFGALVVSIVVHMVVVWYELRAGRRLHSDVLVADALHTRADIFVSLSVIGGLIAVRMGYPVADPIIALVVALFIAKIGIDIIRESSPTLMDEAAMVPMEVEQIALEVPGVVSCHKVRSRGHEQAVYADLHIQVDPTISAEQAHGIAHEVQRRLREGRPDIQDVTIHVEPGSGDDLLVRERAAAAAREAVQQVDGALRCDRVEIWQSEGEPVLSFRCTVHGETSVQEAHRIASELELAVRQQLPQIQRIMVHTEPL
jgi:cation diffusion facilitator family transporter